MSTKTAVVLIAAALSASAITPPSSRPSPMQSASVRKPLTIPAGALLRVRLDQSVSTASDRAGERFSGTLISPVAVDGETVLPRGATVHGIVSNAKPSGRLRGRGYLTLALKSVTVNGRTVPVATSSVTRVSKDHKKRNLALIGGGSGLGALIGGIAGGGKGALIGAGAGAAAGTGGAYATGKRQVRIPAESVLTFRLRQPLTV